MKQPPFQVAHRPFLIAVGNDLQILVDRSLAMSTTDPKYQPISEHIADHGMVLVERKTGPKADMYGRVEQSWYATPEARNLLLMDTGIASNTSDAVAVRAAG